MTYIYEFEVFEDEGFLLAFPFDFEGGTQGLNLEDLADSAIDWLKLEIEHCAMHGITLPKPTFGNEPRYGGRIMLVAVDAGIHTVPRMSAAEAARTLGVSPSRVSHLIRDGLLEAFKDGPRTWVTAYSVEARQRDRRGAGRPRRTADREAEIETDTEAVPQVLEA